MRTQVAKCPPPPQPCKLQLLQLPLPIQGPLATSFIWPQDGLLLFFPRAQLFPGLQGPIHMSESALEAASRSQITFRQQQCGELCVPEPG